MTDEMEAIRAWIDLTERIKKHGIVPIVALGCDCCPHQCNGNWDSKIGKVPHCFYWKEDLAVYKVLDSVKDYNIFAYERCERCKKYYTPELRKLIDNFVKIWKDESHN